VPRGVREVIERRVRRLPVAAQRLLRAACACTAGFSLADARALTDVSEESLLDSLDAALAANLLRVADSLPTPRYDFAHALIRHSLYTSLNPDRRAQLHLRTAQALERGPVNDELVSALATHYRLAGRFAAPRHSIDYAVRAGEVAQSSFAYEDVVTHWQSALDLMTEHGAEPERRAALLEKLGDQLFVTNPGDERALASHERALALYEQLGHTADATRIHFRTALLFAAIASERQDVLRAMRHLDAAATSVADDNAALRAEIEAVSTCTRFFRLRLSDALDASLRALDALARVDDEVLRVIVFVHRGMALAAAGELSASQAIIAEAFELANRRNLPFFTCVTTVWAGTVRCDLLDPVDARRWFERELALPRSSRAPVQRQWLTFVAARAQLMMGDIVEPPSDLPSDGFFRAVLNAGHAYLAGDWQACLSAATLGLDRARRRSNLYVEVWAAHQLARLALAENDLPRGEDLLARSLDQVAGQHRPWEALLASDLAILYATQGRPEDAQKALDQCRRSLPEHENWRGLIGRLSLAEAMMAVAERRSTHAQTHFARALAVFRRYRLPWDEAQVLECWGVERIVSGDSKTGDRRLDAAATIYRRHGAGQRWLQRVARLRSAARDGHTSTLQGVLLDRLSHREVEVLRLVAEGRSNQEIADELVLSVRTVERHLGSMYDKIGASGKPARAVAAAYGIANGLVPASEALT
jgi:DNA-binding CsgD family transcriptional regulator/tetratricopeptide (TPR) repeat protein